MNRKAARILTQAPAHCKAVLRYTPTTVASNQFFASLGSLLLVLMLAAPSARAQAGAPGPPDAPPQAATPVLDEATQKLHQAAMIGNLADVRAALAANASINAENEGHMTALGVAALYGHAEVVTTLLRAGGNVGADQGGETVLMLAAHEGHAPVVEALLTAGADIKAKDRNGMTALMAAAASNRAAALRVLLAKGADPNAANPDGATALMAATFGGHVEAVQVLLGAGANMNITDSNGRTPLMAAALSGNAALARVLIDRKVDLNAEDAGGLTAVNYAAANGHLEFVDLLEKAGVTKGNDLALAFAVRGCHTPVIRRLLDAGAKTTVELQGSPMIVLAAAANCIEAVDTLMKKGADVNGVNEDGETALMQAAQMGFVELVQMLLDHGADLEKTSKGRQSAWLLAAMGNQLEVVEIFKKYRAAHPTNPQ